MNSYDTTGEYGRAGFDIRHRFSLFGSILLPWKVSLNPFVTANTGPGFNITTGQDLNLDRQYNERPSFANVNANCADSTIRCTRFGNFNLRPLPGEQIIPRNFGNSPGSFVVNMRVSRTFQFGVITKTAAGASKAGPTGQPASAPAGGEKRVVGGPGGPNATGGVGGAKTAAVGAPPPQGGGGAPSEYRYSLNVSLSFQNLFNRVNLSQPVGNLSSPSFGESLGVGGFFGGFGGGGSSGAGNRRIYAQVRLNF
jgi:hypothetical protein